MRHNMTPITHLLDAAAAGDRKAAADLLPLVYDELRKLAAVKMAAEAPGNTLQSTALVHEAYLRVVGSHDVARWQGRVHFFAAAAEAMRRILIDAARRKKAEKRGGAQERAALDPDRLPAPETDPDQWIALDQALTIFAQEDPVAAELAKLRLCVGLTVEEAGDTLGLSRATAFRQWTYARAWLSAALSDPEEKSARE
jgi:RNA polymerase sigma factor (TIGR02999 family)